ncbi:MAG: sensor histidine kinase [Haloarculaceae archaeon]
MTGRSTRRVVGAAAVVAVGCLTALVHVVHLYTEQVVRAWTLGGLVPLSLSLLLAGAGVQLYRGELADALSLRVAAWVGGGLFGGLAFGYPVIPYQAAHGVTLVDVPFLVANWATVGAIGGFLIGHYDAYQRQYHAELAAERAELAAREEELARQNERLEQFASVISHDLRNPLNVAAGRIDLAREDCDTEHLGAAAHALDRMETLVSDLLALARQGRPIDERERLALSTVAERAWQMVETGDATLTVERDGTLEADPDRLQQLFENLFRNAVEHGSTGSLPTADDAVEHGSTSSRTASDDGEERGDGGVAVRVGTCPGGFYVADDGQGIPESERGDVFASGYSTATEGTGLGLAIVDEIAEAHGWTVTATESAAGGARIEVDGVTGAD